MKALSSSAQRALLGALRIAIGRDPWFAGWLDPTSGGPALVVEGFACEPWASLTFSGARHRLAIRLLGPVEAVEAATTASKRCWQAATCRWPGISSPRWKLASARRKSARMAECGW